MKSSRGLNALHILKTFNCSPIQNSPFYCILGDSHNHMNESSCTLKFQFLSSSHLLVSFIYLSYWIPWSQCELFIISKFMVSENQLQYPIFWLSPPILYPAFSRISIPTIFQPQQRLFTIRHFIILPFTVHGSSL